MAPLTLVRFRDRRTGAVLDEQIPAAGWLRWLYETASGRLLGAPLYGSSVASRLAGWWQDAAWSRRSIAPFVERFGIDPGEAERPLGAYASFNDFFTRRLKPGVRPFDPDPATLCSPGDGKVLVYPELDAQAVFPVKGSPVRVGALVGNPAAATQLAGGAALVLRLAPPDYHRFHFPFDAFAGPPRPLPGRCHSVNPVALARVAGLLEHNRRTVCWLDAARFGRSACVEVGAFAVASIVQTYTPGPVRRGQEKGYFQFGGSTVVLLFGRGCVRFDEDLIRDAGAGLEVAVRTGERLGCAP